MKKTRSFLPDSNQKNLNMNKEYHINIFPIDEKDRSKIKLAVGKQAYDVSYKYLKKFGFPEDVLSSLTHAGIAILALTGKKQTISIDIKVENIE